MRQEDARKWMQCETRLVRCTDAIRMHYKVYGTTPLKPSSFGFNSIHKTHRLAKCLVAVAHDWFIIWMGFLSYLIAQSRANPFNWPDRKRKDWGQKGTLPKWYMVLREEGFPEDWLSGLLTSDVCDFSQRTPRAGIVIDWTLMQRYLRVNFATENLDKAAVQVLKLHHRAVLATQLQEIVDAARERQRLEASHAASLPFQAMVDRDDGGGDLYDTTTSSRLTNEWDLFHEFAPELKLKNGQEYAGYEHSDGEDDGFDPFEGYEHLYVGEDQNVSTSPDGIPPSGTSPGPSPASPEPEQPGDPMDTEINILASSGLPAPCDDLSEVLDQPLVTTFAFNTVERINEDLYMFQLPPSPSCKWVIGVDPPRLFFTSVDWSPPLRTRIRC
ncbi:unnamed protein product [Cyclocybe aegerita]|uniref:Uncharacterized protein n=1 Tax=Cyclocybe aegerita TaxID=1973307 RepID=A0A8S0XRA2_CYCAE|nr:unnamed protein product [Cyclocybe aegerita]